MPCLWCLVRSTAELSWPINLLSSPSSFRDYYLYHILWIFGKLPKRGGGGSFPIRKILLRFFGKETGWGRCTPKNFVAKSATLFSENRVGGSEAIWKISENSSNMVTPYFNWNFWYWLRCLTKACNLAEKLEYLDKLKLSRYLVKFL